MAKNGVGEEGRFEFLEGGIFFVGPAEWSVFASEVIEGNGDGSVVINKTSIEIAESKEDLNVVGRARSRPVCDGGQFFGVHLDPISANQEAKVFHLTLVELAFLGVGKQVSVFEFVEDEFDMGVMFSLGFRENEDVVKVDNTENAKIFAKGVLDEGLKGGGCIGESKRHDEVLVESLRCPERGFPFIASTNSDEVERVFQVDYSEYLAALSLVEKIINVRNWVTILLGDGVETSVVDTEAQFASFAFDEEDGGSCGGSGTTDETFGEIVVQIITESLGFVMREAIHGSKRG